MIHVLDELFIRSVFLNVGPAWIAKNIISVLIGAKIEVGRSVSCSKIVNVLLQKGIEEIDCGFVGNINGTNRRLTVVAVRRVLNAKLLHGNQQCIHVTGAIDKWDNTNATLARMRKNGIHLGLREGISIWIVVVCLVARLDSGFDIIASVRLAVHRERHVI